LADYERNSTRTTMYTLCLLLLFVASAFAQTCTVNTDTLNVRSCAGTNCGIVGSLSNGASVTLVSAAAPVANGYTWAQIGNGRWVARSFLNCNGGGNPTPPPPSGGGGNSFSSYPTSYGASGFTFTGRRAQVLHFLKARFTASATTYNGHSDGPLSSADLWTNGAASARDNSGVASMNQLADYVAANLGPLGIKYVIWKQRINTGSGWKGMENRGSITQNHFDHVHITFEGGFHANEAGTSTYNQATTDSVPSWAVALFVLNFVIIAAVGAVVVTLVRLRNQSREVRE